jgi:hypothetical protein
MRLPALGELLPVVFERVPFETFEADALEEPRRDDAIGVDVVTAQGHAAPESVST